VWTTAGREPEIDEEVELINRASIASTARSLNLIPHAVGMVSDHIHVVASIPPTVSVSEAVGRLKGAASHAVNEGNSRTAPFRWQREYGALSISDRGLPVVTEYALNQRQRHAANNLIATLERIELE
jgi:REP element-mobilizing transposase RayT